MFVCRQIYTDTNISKLGIKMGCINSRHVEFVDKAHQIHYDLVHRIHGPNTEDYMYNDASHFVSMRMPLSQNFGELRYRDYRRSIDYTNRMCKNCLLHNMYTTLRIGSDMVVQSSVSSSTSS